MTHARTSYLTVLLLLLGAGKANDAVVVDKKPVTIDRRSYDPDHPPVEMPPLTPEEAGVTVSQFNCESAVHGLVLNQHTRGDGTHTATVKIERVKVSLRLAITIWVSSRAPQKTHDHEEGHRKISEQFYADADKVAHDAAEQMVGKTISGTGKSDQEAASAALQSAASKINTLYMEGVNDPCKKVQDVYDRITAHGTNKVKEDDAIRQAMDEVKKDSETSKSDSDAHH